MKLHIMSVLVALMLVACGGREETISTPDPTATPVPTLTPEPSSTPDPTATPTMIPGTTGRLHPEQQAAPRIVATLSGTAPKPVFTVQAQQAFPTDPTHVPLPTSTLYPAERPQSVRQSEMPATPLPALTATPTSTVLPTPTSVLPPGSETLTTKPENRFVRAARKAAAEYLKTSTESLVLQSWEGVSWSDSSIGCAKKGFFYAQAEVPGFKITFIYEGQSVTIHVNERKGTAFVPVDCVNLGTTNRPRPGASLFKPCDGAPDLETDAALREVQYYHNKSGSIPACAGQPAPVIVRTTDKPVYPRVCGATEVWLALQGCNCGLSPRVRGNPWQSSYGMANGGSIPACAGQPLDKLI